MAQLLSGPGSERAQKVARPVVPTLGGGDQLLPEVGNSGRLLLRPAVRDALTHADILRRVVVLQVADGCPTPTRGFPG